MPDLNLENRKIEYHWHGSANANAPTLIFLHDGIGCASLWRDFPAKLAEATDCRAFVYSRFGYGLSDPVELPRPIRFMHDEALETLPKIIDAMKIERPILIGHSDGASIALIYAASKFGKNVRGLILEAPHVFVEDITVQSIFRASEEYRTGDLRERLERHHGRNVDVAFWGWNRVWLDPEFRSWNIEEYLSNIHCPILAIQGEQDNFGTQWQLQSISNRCSGTVKTILLPDCEHTPHKEQRDSTFRSMVEFIRSLPDDDKTLK